MWLTFAVYVLIFGLCRVVRVAVFSSGARAVQDVETLPFEAVVVPLGSALFAIAGAWLGTFHLATLWPRWIQRAAACCAAGALGALYAECPRLSFSDGTGGPALVHYVCAVLASVALARSGILPDAMSKGADLPLPHVALWALFLVLVACVEGSHAAQASASLSRTFRLWVYDWKTVLLLCLSGAHFLATKAAASAIDACKTLDAGAAWLLQPRRMWTGFILLQLAEAFAGAAALSVGAQKAAPPRPSVDVGMATLVLLLHASERLSLWLLMTTADLVHVSLSVCSAELAVRALSTRGLHHSFRVLYLAVAALLFFFVSHRMAAQRTSANAHKSPAPPSFLADAKDLEAMEEGRKQPSPLPRRRQRKDPPPAKKQRAPFSMVAEEARDPEGASPRGRTLSSNSVDAVGDYEHRFRNRSRSASPDREDRGPRRSPTLRLPRGQRLKFRSSSASPNRVRGERRKGKGRAKDAAQQPPRAAAPDRISQRRRQLLESAA